MKASFVFSGLNSPLKYWSFKSMYVVFTFSFRNELISDNLSPVQAATRLNNLCD